MNDNIFHTATKENFLLSTDKTKLDINLIHKFLSEKSYWAKNITLENVQRSIENSLCFGIYMDKNQIGFARIISDYSTFAYLADVFIVNDFRGKGLSKWLIENIINLAELQGLRRWMLATRDAHGLYEQFGFTLLSNPEIIMQKHNPDIYKNI